MVREMNEFYYFDYLKKTETWMSIDETDVKQVQQEVNKPLL